MLEWPYAEYYSENKISKYIRDKYNINEPLNVFTSYLIIFISCFYYFLHINCNYYFKFILLIVGLNGLFAGLAHTTNNKNYILLDKWTMYIPVFITKYYLYPNYIMLIYLFLNIYSFVSNHYLKLFNIKCCYNFNKLIFNTRDYDNIYFGFNIIITLILIYCKNNYINLNYIFLLLIDCIRFPYGHSIWHILGSLSLINIITSNNLIYN